MIIGIGSDIVDMRRIESVMNRFGDRFIERCFTKTEQAQGAKKHTQQARIAFYSRRFAAKEACAKALGTGIVGGILFREIGVENDSAGRPFITLSGAADKALKRRISDNAQTSIHLSLSDEPPYAQAFVVIERHI
jgi:holo-[acyl-carrier protein] synthase